MDRQSGASTTFGELLRRLRKRVGMTQDDLAAATGYSRSLVGALERNDRLPDIDAVAELYLPALGLQEEPLLAAQLVELAARARGERPPATLAFKAERPPAISQAAAAAAYRMPAPPTDILGRDEEIDRLCNRLLGHHGRLLTLVGPPGVGKTRLAQAVGAKCQPLYRDGACFVPLAALNDPALLAATLVSALKLHEGSGSPQTVLVERLRRKELLLVLDNLEQLLIAASEAVALVAELLAECSGVCILVTSRERLHVRAEQRYRVPPLSLGAAVDLFVQRSTAVDPDFTLTVANRRTVEAICEQVDRLPLALELCAAKTDLLSLAQLLARLQDRRLELLVDGAHDLSFQHRTLRAAIGHSYALLDEEERTLFRSLGVFLGGCALEAIEVVSGWRQEMAARPLAGRPLLSTLHQLIGKSLVHAETTPGGTWRFLLLETIREYALEQARAAGEEDALRQRHYAAYLQLFRTADAHLRGPESLTWFALLEPEQGNLRAALQWTLDRGCYADMAWLLLAAEWFWSHTGHWEEAGGWYARLLPHRDILDADVRLAILIAVHVVAGASQALGPLEPYTAEMMSLLGVCSDQLLHAAAWHFVAEYSADQSDSAAASERSIACARAAAKAPERRPQFGLLSDRDFLLGDSLWAYADRLIEHGEFERAAPLLAESATMFRKRGSGYEVADSVATAGRLALLRGDLSNAGAFLHEAVTLGRTFSSLLILARAQPVLALVTLYNGDVPEARRLLMESLRICLDLNHRFFLARVCACLAETALWEGELTEAERWLAQSFAYPSDPDQTRIEQTERLWLAARLSAAQGACQRAATLFGAAEGLRRQIGYGPVGMVRELSDAALARVRASLEPEAFDEAFVAGQRLSPQEAYAVIV